MTPTNEQIAAWLDPDRKRAGWWRRECMENMEWGPWQYTGPDFYDAAVCEVEVAPVVLAAGCQYWRTHEFTQVSTPINEHFNEIMRSPHHPTACILALAKIKEADNA